MTVQSGRLDQALLAVMERVCARHIEPRLGVPVWNHLKPVAARQLKRLGVPRVPLTEPQMELARVAVYLGRAVYQRRLASVR